CGRWSVAAEKALDQRTARDGRVDFWQCCAEPLRGEGELRRPAAGRCQADAALKRDGIECDVSQAVDGRLAGSVERWAVPRGVLLGRQVVREPGRQLLTQRLQSKVATAERLVERTGSSCHKLGRTQASSVERWTGAGDEGAKLGFVSR